MDNEVDKFLAGLDDTPADDPFKTEEADPFAKVDGEAESKEEDKEEKSLPFHKDPKIQKFIAKEIEKGLKDVAKPSEVQQFIEETKGVDDEDDLVAAFTQIIGNDTLPKQHALKLLGKKLKQVEENSSAKALQALQAQAEEEQDAEVQARDELYEGFDSIEEQFDVDITSNTPAANKLRGDYIEFVKRIAPKDSNGEVLDFPDFAETFKVFKDMRRPASNDRAKELSQRSMQRSTDASNAPKNVEINWRTVDKLFNQ